MFVLICENFPGFGNLVEGGAEFPICRILRKPAAFTSLPAIFPDPFHQRNSVIGSLADRAEGHARKWSFCDSICDVSVTMTELRARIRDGTRNRTQFRTC